MLCKMQEARLFKLTVCFALLLFVGYLIFDANRTSWSAFSQLLETVKTTNHATDALSLPQYDMVTKTKAHTDIRVESSQLSQLVSDVSKSKPTVGVAYKATSTQANATAVISSDQVGSWKSATLLIQEITELTKAQLELNKKAKPFFVKTQCVLNSKSKYACVHPNCRQLSNNVTERVQSLMSEKTVLYKEQDDLLKSISLKIPENDVILVSGASSNHYDEMQAMLHSLHSMVFPELSQKENFSLVLWDIGLTSDQRQQVEKCCLCQVISFPFEKFPQPTRDLHTYMWKPLLIRMTLFRARKYVVYQDASIRYKQFPGPVYENGMQHGLQLMREMDDSTTVHRTLPETFAYLGQKVCSFYPYQELGASFGVYKHHPFVLRAVTNVWARCAFEEKCMSPRPTMPSLSCHYGPCHR
ncbi:unnamed protein product [Candidula unifasciata]|uniref:Uncharacterized protein n=1 Tax=Candidula unifasciata TaxID=100452 RepID=A0A8S3YHY4_9EUPU|nr:unnamed protein product [Candidula unifasciata]